MRVCGAQPASKSQPGMMQTTTSALEDPEDRSGPSHGMDNPPPPPLRLQGVRHTDPTEDLATTGDSWAHHPSPQDPDPARQQIEVLNQFGDQQVSTVPKGKLGLVLQRIIPKILR